MELTGAVFAALWTYSILSRPYSTICCSFFVGLFLFLSSLFIIFSLQQQQQQRAKETGNNTNEDWLTFAVAALAVNLKVTTLCFELIQFSLSQFEYNDGNNNQQISFFYFSSPTRLASGCSLQAASGFDEHRK